MESEIKLAERMRENSCEIIDGIFAKISKKILGDEITENYERRGLNITCVDDGTKNEMIGVVISDNTEIILFCNETSQSNGTKKVRCFFAISKKNVQYLHFESNTVISGSLEEVYSLERETIKSVCTFKYLDEDIEDPEDIQSCKVKIGRKRVKTIKDVINLSDCLRGKFAYYIPQENYNRINIFMSTKTSFPKTNEVKKILKNESDVNTIVKKIVKKSTQEISRIQSSSVQLDSQIICSGVAKYILEIIIPELFKEK